MRKEIYISKIRYNRGQAVIGAVILFVAVSSATSFGLVDPLRRSVNISSELADSKQSYAVAESLLEDVLYRQREGESVSNVEALNLNGHTAFATTTTVAGGLEIEAGGKAYKAERKIGSSLISGVGGSFFYGVQVGDGGVSFTNSAEVDGSLYSNGTIVGSNSPVIRGDAISAGATGKIEGFDVNGNAYAHTIKDSDIDGDAYYQVITNSDVDGTMYPNSPDPSPIPLPITDEQIEEWKDEAVAGGSVTCSGGSYNISGAVSLGPKRIPCTLNLDSSDTLTLTGPIWVDGNFNASNSAKIKVASSLSGKTVPFVVDDEDSQISNGRINLSNSATFTGYGTNSFIILVSMNKSAEQGGSNTAIQGSNSISGDVILYAPHGKINLSNSVHIKEVTSYKLQVTNSVLIEYDTGLADLIFSSGPSGGYTIGEWGEVE